MPSSNRSVVVLILFLGWYFQSFTTLPCFVSAAKASVPNIVVILTDDLDLTLGGAGASTLRKTRQLILKDGVFLSNWFAQTPVCCPSRAELLTGKMFHNLRTTHWHQNDTMDGQCMHVNVSQSKHSSSDFYTKDYFASYFSSNPKLNYSVGIFGKHLNTENPKGWIPDGVDRWLVNGGGNYLNPTFTWASRGTGRPIEVKFDNCTTSSGTTPIPCYSTSIIGNSSIQWIRDHVMETTTTFQNNTSKQQPFFAYISVKAPHLQDSPTFPQSIPAPWYKDTIIQEQVAPRTPSYNLSCPDHHWLVRSQQPITSLEGSKIDELYVNRLKTLLSVDDLVEALYNTLEELTILDNTYIVFTSDNGYRLGQFRMPIGKFHAYENDIRLPMMIRGPGIRPPVPASSSSSSSFVASSPSSGSSLLEKRSNPILGSHVDLMPTLLGLALKDGGDHVIPSTMDGTNLAQGLLHYYNHTTAQRQRSSLLIEYMSLGKVFRYNHTDDTYNHTFMALRILEEDPYSTIRLSNSSRMDNHTNTSTAAKPKKYILNLKYVEYRDSTKDWLFEKPPLEMELFDLNTDPYEIHNIVSKVPPKLLYQLQTKISRLFHCQGDSCREEHSTTGIDDDIMDASRSIY